MRALHRRNAWLPVIGGVVALAWLTLAIWEQSPYGRYLNHGRWTEIGLASTLCQLLPAGSVVLPATLYICGWVLMTVAMMLPTALPLLTSFGRMTQDRRDRGLLITLLILGYVFVWGAFGLIAHFADMVLHAVLAGNAFLVFNGWIVGVILLGVAGAFQFSKLKYHCLDKCRTPFSFINQHWHGAYVRRQSLMLGVYHGIILRRLLLGNYAFDVCCWYWKRRLDARDRRGDGDREECRLGSTAERRAWDWPAASLGHHHCIERLSKVRSD